MAGVEVMQDFFLFDGKDFHLVGMADRKHFSDFDFLSVLDFDFDIPDIRSNFGDVAEVGEVKGETIDDVEDLFAVELLPSEAVEDFDLHDGLRVCGSGHSGLCDGLCVLGHGERVASGSGSRNTFFRSFSQVVMQGLHPPHFSKRWRGDYGRRGGGCFFSFSRYIFDYPIFSIIHYPF